MSMLLLLGGSAAPAEPEWSIVVTERDGTPVDTFTSDDTAANAPIVAFDGQDTQNEIGVGHITVPAEDSVNDSFTEDNLLHLYVRGVYVTSYHVKAPVVQVIASEGEAREFAVYQLSHLLAVTEEGIVEPPGGMDFQPAAPDRAFNFASPELDDSTWPGSTELASFSTIFGNVATQPADWPPGSSAAAIWSRNYDTSGGNHNMPLGTSYFRQTFTLDGGDDRQCRVVVFGDDLPEVWLDGILLDSRVGVEPPAMLTPVDIKLSPGSHTIAVKVTNIDRPGNSDNIALLFFAVWTMFDGSDSYDTELVYSATATKCQDYPTIPPGFNAGEIILQTLGEEQDLGFMTDVTCSFTPTHDTAGHTWSTAVDISTKSTLGLEQFWVKELTAERIDIDAHWDADVNAIVVDAWNKGTHQPASGVTLTEGSNLGPLTLTQARRLATSFAVTWNNGGLQNFSTVATSPETGHVPRRRGLSLGGAHSSAQVTRDATAQLDLFYRAREKPALAHLTGPSTAVSELPPAYWKWSTITVSLTSRWVTSGTLNMLAVSFRLNANGLLEFTPETGDLIIPTDVQASQTLRRMAGNSLAGQARTVSPLSA